LLPPLWHRGCCVVFIHCFLDDSGKESQPTMPVVTMAGYCAESDALNSVHRKWAQLLLKHGIPGIHMKELIHLSGTYRGLGWDMLKRDAVLSDFISVIREERLVGIGVAVKMSAWRGMVKEHRDVDFGTVQQFCLKRILRRVIDRLSSAQAEDSVALVFDRDPEFSSNRINLFNALLTHRAAARKLLCSITFADSWRYPGLQCADILAWETRKEMMQRLGGHQSTKRWIAMFTKMPQYHLDYIGELWDEQGFEDPKVIESFRQDQVSSVSSSSPKSRH
jgi:Protein of unknown function (DUF3800)